MTPFPLRLNRADIDVIRVTKYRASLLAGTLEDLQPTEEVSLVESMRISHKFPKSGSLKHLSLTVYSHNLVIFKSSV